MKHLTIRYSISILAEFLLSTAPFSRLCYAASVFSVAVQCPAWFYCDDKPCYCVLAATSLLLVHWSKDLFTKSLFLFD